MKKFRLARRSIIDETFWVEAEDEDEALQIAREGGAVHDPNDSAWVDWHDDRYEVTKVEELDPLYVMVRDHDRKMVDKLVE